MAGIFGAMANITQGDPKTKGHLVVFDPAVFNRTNGMLRDWTASNNEWDDVYNKFKTDWRNSYGDAKARTEQERSFLDDFYDGDFANYLAGLRQREGDARRVAGDRALQYARGATDRASMLRGEPTGTSSATRAMALRYGKDIENDIALNDVARERADFDYLTRNKAAFMGQRQKLTDALMSRQLLPHQLNDAELMQSIKALGGIQALRMGSASPEFYKDLDTIQKLAGAFDTVVDTAGNLLSAYGGGGYKNGSQTQQSAGDSMPQAVSMNSSPYSTHVGYDDRPVTGGTTFNYSYGAQSQAPAYNTGMSYDQGGGRGGTENTARWLDFGVHY